MRIPAHKPATTPISGLWSATEGTACRGPPRSPPTRGPQGPLGDPGVWPRLGWGLATAMPWPGWPRPNAPAGPPARHAPHVAQASAPWAPEGSLAQAFRARVAPRAAEPPLHCWRRHGDGPPPWPTRGRWNGRRRRHPLAGRARHRAHGPHGRGLGSPAGCSRPCAWGRRVCTP
jgi:hypothetical protein